MTHRRLLAAASAVLVGVVVGLAAGPPRAAAYWTRGRGTASAVVATLPAPGEPTTSGSRTLTLAWDAPASAGDRPVRYRVERRLEGSDVWTPVCGTDVAAMTGRVCTDTPATGSHRYRVRASLGSWSVTGPESAAAVVGLIGTRATSSASTGSSGASSVTVAVPATVAAGDLLLVHVAFDRGTDAGTDATITPAGWSLGARTNVSNSFGQAVVWRRATGAEAGGSVTIPFARSVRAAAGLVALTGVDATAPFGAVGSATGTSDALQAPSVAAGDGTLLLVAASVKRQRVSLVVPAAMTAALSFQNAQDVSAVVATQALGGTGATGARTVTSSTSGDWVAMSLVLRAA